MSFLDEFEFAKRSLQRKRAISQKWDYGEDIQISEQNLTFSWIISEKKRVHTDLDWTWDFPFTSSDFILRYNFWIEIKKWDIIEDCWVFYEVKHVNKAFWDWICDHMFAIIRINN